MSSCNIRKYTVLFFAAITLFLAVLYLSYSITKIPGYDFRLRYHEVEVLRQGIDPYDIVAKNVPSIEFASFSDEDASPDAKKLHVYTPWEYT